MYYNNNNENNENNDNNDNNNDNNNNDNNITVNECKVSWCPGIRPRPSPWLPCGPDDVRPRPLEGARLPLGSR